MPVKRRLAKSRVHKITPEAIEAFEAGDYHALHQALGLKPWEHSPLPLAVTALGVRPGEPPSWDNSTMSWRQAQELQRALVDAGAKMPAGEATKT
jgi:hypothetical protein